MVADATQYYAVYPLYLWLPVSVIALLTLSLNLLGDSVRTRSTRGLVADNSRRGWDANQRKVERQCG